MNDLSAHVKAVTRLTLFFLSLCFLAWALFPAHKSWWGGLAIGGAASLLNARHLAWKVQSIGSEAEALVNKRVNSGFLTRACIALLAAVIAMEYSFQVSATVAGFFITQLATLILGFWAGRKQHASVTNSVDERGENN